MFIVFLYGCVFWFNFGLFVMFFGIVWIDGCVGWELVVVVLVDVGLGEWGIVLLVVGGIGLYLFCVNGW